MPQRHVMVDRKVKEKRLNVRLNNGFTDIFVLTKAKRHTREITHHVR